MRKCLGLANERQILRRHDALHGKGAQIDDRSQHLKGFWRMARAMFCKREREPTCAGRLVDTQKQRLMNWQVAGDELRARQPPDAYVCALRV
jgi:hypothetical protein